MNGCIRACMDAHAVMQTHITNHTYACQPTFIYTYRQADRDAFALIQAAQAHAWMHGRQ